MRALSDSETKIISGGMVIDERVHTAFQISLALLMVAAAIVAYFYPSE